MEKAVLIGLITPDIAKDQAYEYLDELSFLAKTAGAKPVKLFTQRLSSANNKTFIGKGKIEEIKIFVEDHNIDSVIFDDDLTPSQMKNIERALEGKVKILDRSNLILDIFASRAKTSQARTQVELAQYQYLLPRLTGLWTHLERQKGGIGMRGPGETQIETDRQIIRDKITLLKKKLKKIDKQSHTRRKGREHLIRVALIGYTNAGKSTLMNRLAKSEVFAENKLFATLDTTVRKVVIGNLPFLLTDTVGFIRKLPHQLVESFKSTLDEVRESDFMIHLVDISNPNFEDHIDVVNKTIAELGANNKPTLIVFNKIDAYKFIKKEEDDLTPSTKENNSLEDLKKTWMSKIETNTMFISALNKTHFEELKNEMYSRIKELHEKRYPYNSFLY
ncbi:GTPase HflX [Flavobacteriales bacterium]|jgi:GTP-binding protein HflX|nr:GTPase HflX [Flavobacteriales bacterium]MDA7578047.1 GTPase HflX [Flavobacteriales bacterium]MDA7596241.1 GTPase HflX [Flavobacteriales bacterium]MDC0909397.1 GTPase HflX [Flavobacteriales bacterium]|tara:strand:+ start:133 stop:1302 length:1170 start_codon:yes stop_codon:yes gene_type:complete